MGHVHGVLNVNAFQEEAIITSLYIFPWFIIFHNNYDRFIFKTVDTEHNLNGYFHGMLIIQWNWIFMQFHGIERKLFKIFLLALLSTVNHRQKWIFQVDINFAL